MTCPRCDRTLEAHRIIPAAVTPSWSVICEEPRGLAPPGWYSEAEVASLMASLTAYLGDDDEPLPAPRPIDQEALW